MGGSDCEVVGGGFLAQPANAWSSVAYLLAGVYVLVRCRRPRGSSPPMRVAAGVGLIVVAVGSFAFHGPQPAWAGPLHDASIAGLLAVCVFLSAREPRAIAAATGAAVAVVATVVLLPSADGAVHGSLAVAVGAAEVRRRRDQPVPLGVVALFAIAVALLAVGRTGGPLCAPESRLQAHAGWHVVSAVAAALALTRTGPPARDSCAETVP